MAPTRKGPASRGTRRQQQQQQQRRPRVPPAPRPSAGPKSAGLGSALSRYDPRTQGHLPGPRASGPYTVVRERVTINMQTNISGQHTVLLIGPFVKGSFQASGGEAMSSLVAVKGVGQDEPGVTETLHVSNLFHGTTYKSKSCSLHSMHAELTCTGASSGMVPSGNVFAGAITQPLSRTNWGKWEDIGHTLQTRRAFRMFSAYETMTKPISICSYPLDAVEHTEFLWMAGSAHSSDEMSRALTPIVFVLGPTASANDFTVSLTLEWRVRESLDPILQSTHRAHVPVPESVWSQLGAHLATVGGFVRSTAEDPTVQAAVRGAIAAGMRYAPRALALTM